MRAPRRARGHRRVRTPSRASADATSA
jgi:hypothetical protein